MELLKAIYERRSTRHFSDADVAGAMVHEVLRAAVQAPSALNQQPWAFAVFHGRARLEGYSTRAKAHLLATEDPAYGLNPRIDQYASSEVNVFHGADTLVVVCATPARFDPERDCFFAAQNLMLAAHGFGLATCPIGFARSWFNVPFVKNELGIPPHYTAVLPIVIGHPARPPASVPRNEPEIACWHWDP